MPYANVAYIAVARIYVVLFKEDAWIPAILQNDPPYFVILGRQPADWLSGRRQF